MQCSYQIPLLNAEGKVIGGRLCSERISDFSLTLCSKHLNDEFYIELEFE